VRNITLPRQVYERIDHGAQRDGDAERERVAGSNNEASCSKNFPAHALMTTIAVPTIRKIDPMKPRMIGISQSTSSSRLTNP
jgi:hypothetical protein